MTSTVLVSVNNSVSVRAGVVALVIIGPISCNKKHYITIS